jgi:phage terminase large subunit-like protein
VRRTPAIKPFFRAYDGYRKIVSTRNGGRGMKVYPHDPKTGDGVIPFPYAFIDEPHRHPDMRLYGLWKGKLRKRGAQILLASTGGEPGTEFEDMRDKIREQATDQRRNGAFLRAYGSGIVFHEYMVQSDEDCADMEKVKEANPLSDISVEGLSEEYESPTLDIGDWKRLKCNRATRSVIAAITDAEWAEARSSKEIAAGAAVEFGLDVGWKWDTTAITPLWCSLDWDPGVKPDPENKIKGRPPTGWRLLGPARIITPPRTGSSMHPDEIKIPMLELAEQWRIDTIVMDISRAEDIAAWIEDELGVEVIDREQGNAKACEDYEAFMDGLRNGTLKHTGHDGLKRHAMNAIARKLPGGKIRFDRPSTTRQNVRAQDRRVIDALTAAGMVVQHSTRQRKPKTSVYEERYAAAA